MPTPQLDAPTPFPRLLTLQEAADALDVSLRKVQNLVALRRIVVTRIDRATRIHPDDLRDYMDVCRGLRTGERAPRVEPKPLSATQTIGVLSGSRQRRTQKHPGLSVPPPTEDRGTAA